MLWHTAGSSPVSRLIHKYQIINMKGILSMKKKFLITTLLVGVVMATFAGGCGKSNNTTDKKTLPSEITSEITTSKPENVENNIEGYWINEDNGLGYCITKDTITETTEDGEDKYNYSIENNLIKTENGNIEFSVKSNILTLSMDMNGAKLSVDFKSVTEDEFKNFSKSLSDNLDNEK